MAIRLVKVEEVTEEERARCRDGRICPWCVGGVWRKLLCSWCAAGRAPIHVACWLEALDPAFYLGLISGKGIKIYVPDTEEETADPVLPSDYGLKRPPAAGGNVARSRPVQARLGVKRGGHVDGGAESPIPPGEQDVDIKIEKRLIRFWRR